MKIGDTYTDLDNAKNALIGQPLTQLFRDAPVRVRAVAVRKTVTGSASKPGAPAAAQLPLPSVVCQFQSGTQLIAQVDINEEFFVGQPPASSTTDTKFQGMAGLNDADEIYNGTVPAGNLSLTFKGNSANYEGVVWDLEVMS